MPDPSKSLTEVRAPQLTEIEVRIACAFVQGRASNRAALGFPLADDLERLIRELRRRNLT